MLPNTLFGHCRWRALECEIFLVTVAAFLDELTDRPAVIICLIRCIHRRRHADRYYSSFFFITVFFMTHRIQHNRDSWIKWVRCKKLTGPNIRLRLVTLSWGIRVFCGYIFRVPAKKKTNGKASDPASVLRIRCCLHSWWSAAKPKWPKVFENCCTTI